MEKPSCRRTALNRCTQTESRWNKKKTFAITPTHAVMRLPSLPVIILWSCNPVWLSLELIRRNLVTYAPQKAVQFFLVFFKTECIVKLGSRGIIEKYSKISKLLGWSV